MDRYAANGLLLLIRSDEQGRHTLWTIHPDGSNQKKILERAEITAATRRCVSLEAPAPGEAQEWRNSLNSK
jgi:hypothetical protein